MGSTQQDVGIRNLPRIRPLSTLTVLTSVFTSERETILASFSFESFYFSFYISPCGRPQVPDPYYRVVPPISVCGERRILEDTFTTTLHPAPRRIPPCQFSDRLKLNLRTHTYDPVPAT